MKTAFPLLIIAILSLFVTPSCSKKSSSTTPTCQIITVTDQLGTSTTIYNITYNNAGQISTEQYNQSGTAYSRVFTYIGSQEIMTTSGGASTITDSMTINSDGFIESDYQTDGSSQTVTNYTYSGNELQKSVSVTNGGTPSTTTYSCTNGDLTSGNVNGEAATYTYNTTASEEGDYWYIAQLINYGGFIVKTAHQLTGFELGTTIENVSYTYDNTGKITALTGTSGSTVENITYQYSCN
jgi:hypothetical protein